jgi:hypothetical protein
MCITFDDETTKVIEGNPKATSEGIPDSKEVSGIEIRILPPFIKNNGQLKVWPLPGLAQLYSLVVVLSDKQNQLSGTMDVTAFPRIGDRERLPINKTIYYWEQSDTAVIAPNQVHVICSIIKSKACLRSTAEIMEAAEKDGDYKDLMSQLGKVVSNAASFNIITAAAMKIAGIVGKYLGRVHDKPLGTIINSFTRLHGDWDKTGVNPITVITRDVDFSLELVIRDKERNHSDTQDTEEH